MSPSSAWLIHDAFSMGVNGGVGGDRAAHEPGELEN